MESDEKPLEGETFSADTDASPSRTASPGPTAKQREWAEKTDKILEACKWRDLEAIRNYATSEDGLISDEVRRLAWPILLGCSNGDDETKGSKESWRALPRHGDEDQVALDVNRSFIYYPNNQTSKEMAARKEELSDLIIEVLRRNPYLCYFQGYHDICQVLLLVLSPQDRTPSVARLSALRIRDFMLPNLSPALAQLRLIPSIITTVNPRLCTHLSQTQPFFALSGTLTMYAHDIQEYGQIARLFDVLLAREAVFSVYMFAQIVLQRSAELFETPADEPEMLHSILSKLPQPLDLESIISKTVQLFNDHPPESLRSWSSISASSVLKTARWSEQVVNQTLGDGERFFAQQVKELEWAAKREEILKMLWKYRRPAKAVGVAVLVGIISFVLNRQGYVPRILGFGHAFWRYWGSEGNGKRY
ncbi:gtpase-activating gyp10 protein [Rutstroemia sp. NJR-2017a WRK4]|nr:gtpase-activating gyp10 protein [Rutstroemia sp. NJR-2017a WRK4]